jgi:hypothetical protein
LILEDDGTIRHDRLDLLNHALNTLEQSAPDWDMLYLYYRYHSIDKPIDKTLVKLLHSPSTVAYAVQSSKLAMIADTIAREFR